MRMLSSQTSSPLRRIVQTWWPLAASWLLMGAELPALSIVVARLAQPEINLAAYAGVVFPLALVIESPIIMLLSASTALSKDWDSYRKVRRFMMAAGAALTALHALVAFTPLYYVVAAQVLGVPHEIVEPARLGLMIMLPWTWSIAYRRFNQGVLIRFGHSRIVGLGTVVRLCADSLVLGAGYAVGTVPGIAVATAAVAAGVMSEALYIGVRVRPVLVDELRPAPKVDQPLTLPGFLAFYIPLALTSLLGLVAQPIGSAALSRMPNALVSLAVWPVVTGMIFMLRNLGMAYNEVVVALLDEPPLVGSLRRFTAWLACITTGLLLLVAATPLSALWFGRISGLPPELAEMARLGLWLGAPLPALGVLQSWYQGTILHSRQTGSITWAVVIFLLTSVAVCWGGVAWGRVMGLYVGLAALALSTATQTAWLWFRSRPARRAVQARAAFALTAPAPE